VHDGRGRLRIRREYTWSSGWILNSETRYEYDGMRVIQERNSSNTPTVSYTRGSDLSGSFEGAGGIGGLLARSHGYSSGSWTGHNFYHADGNGNVTMLIDNAGTPNVTATYRYDPYGNSITTTGTNATANVYRFSSKERHANSGMYYYGYRFYDPNLQRWPNRDPIRELGHFTLRYGYFVQVSGIDRNLYTFVRNAPIQHTDAFGLTEREWPLNGAVCNWCPDDTKVYILVEGEYFTLPTGKCTASNPGGPSTDVDGVWVCTPTASGSSSCTFYKVNPNWGLPFVTCNDNPPENCPRWNGDPKSKNSPKNRGAPGNKPPRDPPIYRSPR
jgi:RHS repeat-associated protein